MDDARTDTTHQAADARLPSVPFDMCTRRTGLSVMTSRTSGVIVPIVATGRHDYLSRYFLTAMLVILAGSQARSCTSRPRRLDFGHLAVADRIVVKGRGDVTAATLTQQTKIRDAVRFIEQYHDGWIEEWRRPRAPTLDLRFYRNADYIGQFGISYDYIVVGGLHQDVSEAQVKALMDRLGLQWW
jgi:hypothetical protein